MWRFETIGTSWVIESSALTEKIKKEVQACCEEFDTSFSRFKDDNFIDKLRHNAGTYQLPKDGLELLNFYNQLYDLTEGQVTPLIGRTLEQAGYDKHYSFNQSELLRPPPWDQALEHDQENITTKQPVVLDFGAAGKGMLVDKIASILKENHIKDFIVNGGGDIFSQGEVKLFQLEDPFDTTRSLGEVRLINEALCGSAGNRRQWGEFHHILHPDTLTSISQVTAVWVKAKSTMIADGLSTALFFVKPDKLLSYFAFEYAIIESGNLRISPNFNARWHTT